jgi:hypothetical protein
MEPTTVALIGVIVVCSYLWGTSHNAAKQSNRNAIAMLHNQIAEARRTADDLDRLAKHTPNYYTVEPQSIATFTWSNDPRLTP